jgi:hypothetical protein
MHLLLKFNPDERVSAEQALQHPYFDEIKKKGYLNSYHNNNQHMQQEDGKPIPLSVALNPIPLNVDREKLGEAAENIKINVRFGNSRTRLDFLFKYMFTE